MFVKIGRLSIPLMMTWCRIPDASRRDLRGIRDGNTRRGSCQYLIELLKNVPITHELPDSWQKEFVRELKDMTDEDNPQKYLSDGTPFLKSSDPPWTDDDIPL
jgi:hypothetical protein